MFASQTLNVVDASGATQASTPATGNSLIASAVASPIDVQSTQRLNAEVSATTIVNATGNAGSTASFSTAATGNTAESNVEETGLTGTSVQSVGPNLIQAYSEFNGPAARAGALSVATQAIANTQGLGIIGSTADFAVSQDNEAAVQSDLEATLQYTAGTAVTSSLATANNITATGTIAANQALEVTQQSTGASVEATAFTYAGNAQTITSQATVTGNNLSATNEEGDLDVAVDQSNTAAINGEAYLSSFQFGSATANAFGVGNSVMAGNFGPTVTLDNTQVNSGGVSVTSSFVGDSGYDAYVTSTAIGNAVTGYACTDCGPGRITVNNSQTNSSGVSATGSVNITSANRSTNGVAAATGNTATFYVTRPQ